MWLKLNKLPALEKHHSTRQLIVDLQGRQVTNLNALYRGLFQRDPLNLIGFWWKTFAQYQITNHTR